MLKSNSNAPSTATTTLTPSARTLATTNRARGYERFLADGSLLLTAILWGINIPVVKYVTLSMQAPLVFNASRMVLSTFTLALLAWIESRYIKQPETKLQVPRLLLFAMLSGLAYPLLFMFGIERTTAGNTALLLSSMPMWTAILSAFFLRERLPLLTWIALSITFVGTAIVLFARGNVDLSLSYVVGNAMILLSAMVWASATVVSGPLLKQITPLRMAFWSSLLTTPIHVLIVAKSLPETLPRFLEWSNMACLIYSGIFSTGVAYATWHVGVRLLGGSHASVYQNVVTLVAVLAGWFVLQEPLLNSQIIGGVLMIAGLLTMRISRR